VEIYGTRFNTRLCYSRAGLVSYFPKLRGNVEMPPLASSGILDLGGVWRSRYSYFSSGRGQEFDSTHYVVFRQSGQQVTVGSLPHPTGSRFRLSLTVDGFTVTGTWVEHTPSTGYYKGAIYRGVIQLLASPSGGQLIGKWIGFGKNFAINTGDWEFVLESRSASEDDIARYGMRGKRLAGHRCDDGRVTSEFPRRDKVKDTE
jgi:hypothetical protein